MSATAPEGPVVSPQQSSASESVFLILLLTRNATQSLFPSLAFSLALSVPSAQERVGRKAAGESGSLKINTVLLDGTDT